ncbi:hypothetical protein [Aequorivita sp. KMM 9714]|uniref:hypothetical protein n=1 Tax=Aequorivita sp. KMM 9714 TaxID=2707173 RepID=UPI0013EE34B7|nr:hypothetical protein [Aequorivita sp. KMM 9714]NGX84610.1 hypothetical protein [Aequorivita sp. KMM 9714]
MAPYKLEDNIREKLESRELKPSEKAWDKLQAKLNAEQPQKKTVLWYYVAASVIGILILSSVFYTNTIEVKDEIVTESLDEKSIDNDLKIIPDSEDAQKYVSTQYNSDVNKPEENKDKEKSQSNSNLMTSSPESPLSTGTKKSEIDKKIDKTKVLANTEKENSFEEELINAKVDEVIASVKELQQNNNEVSITEVEDLLNKARREIQTQKILNAPEVDATALLQEVEWELEKSFRDKVFDALGEGFIKIRTAVIERND